MLSAATPPRLTAPARPQASAGGEARVAQAEERVRTTERALFAGVARPAVCALFAGVARPAVCALFAGVAPRRCLCAVCWCGPRRCLCAVCVARPAACRLPPDARA